MRRTVLGFFALLLFASVAFASELYKVNVTRIDSNLYRDNDSKTIIETRYCYEYAIRDDAVLKWEGRYGTNKLIFSSDTVCDVVALR
jgi:hypothetical protein